MQITRSRGAVGKLLNYGPGEPVLEASSKTARTSCFVVVVVVVVVVLFLLLLPLFLLLLLLSLSLSLSLYMFCSSEHGPFPVAWPCFCLLTTCREEYVD